jgi:plasmid stabilization system protein ParE
VATVLYSARALADLDHLFDFLAEHDPTVAVKAAALIVDAVEVLARHPNIGRPVRGDLRELVISHGRTGYVALYRVMRQHD